MNDISHGMIDPVPAHLMNPERLEWARNLGLGQARAYDKAPERDMAAEELAALGIGPAPMVEAPAQANPVKPQIVGQTITGRQWIVCQLPDGRIRESSDDEMAARTMARTLAADESGEFALFQPRGISRPKTTVTEELL